MRTVSVRLDDKSDALLRAYCARSGLSQTEALREAIRCLSDVDKPRPADLAREFGLIGAFDSGQGDLGRDHSAHVKSKLRKARRA